MGIASIDMVILDIDVGYLVTREHTIRHRLAFKSINHEGPQGGEWYWRHAHDLFNTINEGSQDGGWGEAPCSLSPTL